MYVFIISTEKEIDYLWRDLYWLKLYLKNTKHIIEECGGALASAPDMNDRKKSMAQNTPKSMGKWEIICLSVIGIRHMI